MSAVGRRHGSGMLGETAGVRGREALDPSGPVVNSESGQSDLHNRFIRTVRNGRRPKKKKKSDVVAKTWSSGVFLLKMKGTLS